MPVLSWGHSHYWQTPTSGSEPPIETGGGSAGGYTPWMTTVTVTGSLGGGLQPVYEWIVTRVAREKETR